jgi:hypothetical protein
MRRVVTGHQGGKAVFTSDDDVAPTTIEMLPGSQYHDLWSADAPATFPNDGTETHATK